MYEEVDAPMTSWFISEVALCEEVTIHHSSFWTYSTCCQGPRSAQSKYLTESVVAKPADSPNPNIASSPGLSLTKNTIVNFVFLYRRSQYMTRQPSSVPSD